MQCLFKKPLANIMGASKIARDITLQMHNERLLKDGGENYARQGYPSAKPDPASQMLHNPISKETAMFVLFHCCLYCMVISNGPLPNA